ncbi:hypothetical protein HBB16_13345 [Pseudonocardia sp. MCCB 268]|nr:hypothetical protein [Pseudonocardia cytotoxica]
MKRYRPTRLVARTCRPGDQAGLAQYAGSVDRARRGVREPARVNPPPEPPLRLHRERGSTPPAPPAEPARAAGRRCPDTRCAPAVGAQLPVLGSAERPPNGGNVNPGMHLTTPSETGTRHRAGALPPTPQSSRSDRRDSFGAGLCTYFSPALSRFTVERGSRSFCSYKSFAPCGGRKSKRDAP